jgi:tetratricopeptide (TPR) repeat protein
MQVLARHVNKERALEALEATHRAIEAETDRSKIEKLRVLAGKMLLDTGHPAEALDEFKLVLAGDPESIEGNLGVGLALSQSGDSSKFEEAIPYLRKFVDKAPDSHPMKADVQSTLDAAGPKR